MPQTTGPATLPGFCSGILDDIGSDRYALAVTNANSASADKLRSLIDHSIARLLAPVASALADPSVTEIMINGPDRIYVERGGIVSLLDGVTFASPEHLAAAARAIAQFSGRRLSPDDLSIEARLMDGSRVHILQPPAAYGGLAISIRRFQESKPNIAMLIERGALTPEAADFLRLVVRAKKNVILSGGTGTGKTTLLGGLSEAFELSDRVIVIEDVKELKIAQEGAHVLHMEAQKPDRFGRGGITIRELFRASLRMRPDRILVGECRGGEALDMIQAMTSGHTGSLSTLHANTARDAMHRLETMAMMSDVGLPLRPLRSQIVGAVDLVVQIVREGGRRYVSEISEVVGIDREDHYIIEPIFVLGPFDPAQHGRVLSRTTYTPTFSEELAYVASRLG